MSFVATARVAPEKQDKPACLPLVSSMGGERADMDDIKLNWDKAEQDGYVLVNAPARKLAVFANMTGWITLVVTHDKRQIVTELDPQEGVRLVALLRDAIDDAMPIYQNMVAELAAHDAIYKAAGVVNGK